MISYFEQKKLIDLVFSIRSAENKLIYKVYKSQIFLVNWNDHNSGVCICIKAHKPGYTEDDVNHLF